MGILLTDLHFHLLVVFVIRFIVFLLLKCKQKDGYIALSFFFSQ